MEQENARNVPPEGDEFRHFGGLRLPSERSCLLTDEHALAETVRFELTEELPPRQFSRLLP